MNITDFNIINSPFGVYLEIDSSSNSKLIGAFLGASNTVSIDGLIQEMDAILTSSTLDGLVDTEYMGYWDIQGPDGNMGWFTVSTSINGVDLLVYKNDLSEVHLQSEDNFTGLFLSLDTNDFLTMLTDWKQVLIDHNQG